MDPVPFPGIVVFVFVKRRAPGDYLRRCKIDLYAYTCLFLITDRKHEDRADPGSREV